MKYAFNGNETHTLGVEIELQVIDTETLALSNSVQQLLDRVPEEWSDSFKPEFMQSYCEINTGVCHSVSDVERDLAEKLRWANKNAEELGLHLLWAGTHPFSRWEEQVVSPGGRYAWLMETMQEVARRLVVFGLHVHVGVDSGDKAIQLCDRLLRHLPTLLALSANSPMWCGRDTGMMSHRSKIMEALPTAGMPQPIRNWSEYVWLVDHLVSTGFLQTNREIWWDVRPHANFGTVEVRVMDQPMSMRHLLGLVALTQSMVAAISDHIDNGAYQFDCHPLIAKQNKWHAARYGMDAPLVNPDTMKAVPARVAARMLMERCEPFAERLGCHEQMAYLRDILDNGTGARRQRAVLMETGDQRDVVRYLLRQSENPDPRVAPTEAAKA
jgi:carboxylate-amine ligase